MGMVGWAVFMSTFVQQADFVALANHFNGRTSTGRATVYLLVAWVLTYYTAIAAYNSDPSPPPPQPPQPRRLKSPNETSA